MFLLEFSVTIYGKRILLLYREIFSPCSQNHMKQQICCASIYIYIYIYIYTHTHTHKHTHTYIYIYIYIVDIKLELHKVFTCLKSASHCRNRRIVFKNYSLQLVQVRLSQCYNDVNTAVDCCAVPVYRHIFSATALVSDMQLSSTFE